MANQTNEELKTVKLWALVIEIDGVVRLSHRVKKTYSIYSTPQNHRPLVFDSIKKAEKAMQKTGIGNYIPEGTKIVELNGVYHD